MDVTCERCSTEYEFDDALVSERGTTVKCTNCGHQFKVRRTDGISAPERWVVRTVDGRELEFTALRELQAAIAQTRVTKDDVLSRGSTRPRRLGSIAELEPFFANAGTSTSPGLGGRARVPTPTGLGDAQHRGTTEGSVAIPLPSGSRDSSRSPAVAAPEVSPIAVPTPRPGATMPGVVPSYERPASTPSDPPHTPVYAGAAADIAPPRSVDDPPTIPRAVRVPPEMDPPPPHDARPPYPVARVPDVAATQPSEQLSARRSFDSIPEAPPPNTPTPTDVRASNYDARASYYEGGQYGEPRFSSMAPSRQSGRIRWIGGFVALGVLVFLGLTVGRKYLSAGQKPAASAAPTTSATGSSEERIVQHLRQGEASLLEGDLETAKEHVDKATALGENDPRVASQAARLAMVRGELAWLRVRAMASDDPQLPAARKDLEVAGERARKAAERLAELAPNDAAVPRYRIDALRLAGDREGARKLVPTLSASSTQPDNALVLAALDLSEDKPESAWASVIERLRTAARSEQKLGRARALLVYALARSGALADAKTELDRLAALPRSHPLVAPLTAFLQRADKDGKVVDVGSLPDATRAKRPDPPAADAARPKDAPTPAEGKPAAPTDKKAPRPGDRVPDDYVWPGYADDKPAPSAPSAPPAATGQPAPAPPPKPDTASPGAKP
jgi:predicted Zn finger-like uncharacterized protein